MRSSAESGRATCQSGSEMYMIGSIAACGMHALRIPSTPGPGDVHSDASLSDGASGKGEHAQGGPAPGARTRDRQSAVRHRRRHVVRWRPRAARGRGKGPPGPYVLSMRPPGRTTTRHSGHPGLSYSCSKAKAVSRSRNSGLGLPLGDGLDGWADLAAWWPAERSSPYRRHPTGRKRLRVPVFDLLATAPGSSWHDPCVYCFREPSPERLGYQAASSKRRASILFSTGVSRGRPVPHRG